MDKKNGLIVAAAGAALALAACGAFARNPGERGGNTSKTAASSVVTNENGSVSRTFVESTISTNGNMVTEHRRETRTDLDMDGNVLEATTSEYAQSYSIGNAALSARPSLAVADEDGERDDEGANTVDSFLGLRFGEVFKSTNFVADASYPDFLRATFKPAKPLAGFNDYYVYVTPKTRRIAKVFACAHDTVEPVSNWRRHYLIEALEKRYSTWARLCSYRLPCYAFDVGGGRHVTACLDGASADYSTVVAAWDDALARMASDETEQLREEARKTAAERRRGRVQAAQDAF